MFKAIIQTLKERREKNKAIKKLKADDYYKRLKRSYDHFSGMKHTTSEPTLEISEIRMLMWKKIQQLKEDAGE